MVEFVTRTTALPDEAVYALIPVTLCAIVHVSMTISPGCVCDELDAMTAVWLLANTEFRILTFAVAMEATPTPSYSNRLFSMTVFEFVSLPLLFKTPLSLLRNSQLFTIRFDPAAAWRMPTPGSKPVRKPAMTELSTTRVPPPLNKIPFGSWNTAPFIDRPRRTTLSVAPMFTVMVRAMNATTPAEAFTVSDFVIVAPPYPPLSRTMISPLTGQAVTAP